MKILEKNPDQLKRYKNSKRSWTKLLRPKKEEAEKYPWRENNVN